MGSKLRWFVNMHRSSDQPKSNSGPMNVWPKNPWAGVDVKPKLRLLRVDYLVIPAMATGEHGKPQMKLVHAGQ